MPDFNISFYLGLLRKWIILIIVVAILTAIGTYFIAERRDDIYEAKALVSIGGFLVAPNPDLNEVRIGMELADTYAILITTASTLEATIETLNLDMSPSELSELIDTEILLNTSLLQISVRSSNPELAALIANAISEQLIIQNPSNVTPELQEQVTVSTSQINTLETQSQVIQQLIDNLDTQITEEDDVSMRNILLENRNSLVQQLNENSATIAIFSSNVTQIQQRSNSLTIIDRARTPESSVSLSSVLIAAVATVMIGVVFSGIVFLYEYIKISHPVLNNIEDIKKYINLPVLGTTLSSRDTLLRTDQLITNLQEESPVVESFKILCSTLKYRINQGNQVFIFTHPLENKNNDNTVLNIALTMGALETNTALINLNRRVDYSNLISNLSFEKVKLAQKIASKPLSSLLNIRKKISNFVTFFPVFDISPKSTQVLQSQHFINALNKLIKSKNYDCIIIDASPILLTSDVSVLATKIDADIILMIEHGESSTNLIEHATAQLNQLGKKPSGVILYNVESIKSILT